MVISPFIVQLNHFGIPCGSSATEILCLLDVYSPNLLIYIYIFIGCVAEVVSSNPRWVIKIFFSIYRHSSFIISLHINCHYKSVSISDPM